MTRSSLTQRKTSDEQHLTFHHHEDDEVYQSVSDNEAEVSTDKVRLKKLEIMSKRPKTADEMQTYLETAEDLNILTLVKSQVAIMTKST